MADSPLLTKAEAARWCRVSVAAFDAHIRPRLPVKQVGRRVLVHLSDLEAWALAEAIKPAPVKAPSTRAATHRGGPLRQELLANPRASELRARLQKKLERARERANAANN